jgi:hypothetical protein
MNRQSSLAVLVLAICSCAALAAGASDPYDGKCFAPPHGFLQAFLDVNKLPRASHHALGKLQTSVHPKWRSHTVVSLMST